MKNILYWRIANSNSGMTNQLFTFITGILSALTNNRNIMIVDDFSCDFLEGLFKPISQVIDIEALNRFFNKIGYNITLFDKNQTTFKVDYITYGHSNKVIDVTEEMLKICYTDNKVKNHQLFFLGKNIDFNDIVKDPFPNIYKKCTIHYSLNNHRFIEEYGEKREENILFDSKNANYYYQFGWINSINQKKFELIIQNISFHKDFQKIADSFLETIYTKRKNPNPNKKPTINVVHLRIEDDAIIHSCKILNVEYKELEEKWEKKYISVIEQNIPKEEEIILLSYSTQNSVIDFLNSNGYSYHFIEKDRSKGREWNAIVDLHIAMACNHIFIGNWNTQTLGGSTFSYLISQKLSKEVKTVFIEDMNN